MNKILNVLHQTVLVLVFLPFALLAENHINLKIGEEVYIERCVLCHGKNGEGWDWGKKAVKPPVPVPNLLKVLPHMLYRGIALALIPLKICFYVDTLKLG